jgi:hypothetical protein
MHSVTDAMIIFGIAVGVTALFCYVVVGQSQNRRVNRTSSGDSSWSADTGYDFGDSGHHQHGARPIIRTPPAIQVMAITPAAAMEEEAATAVVAAAIRAVPANRNGCVVVPVPRPLLDSF